MAAARRSTSPGGRREEEAPMRSRRAHLMLAAVVVVLGASAVTSFALAGGKHDRNLSTIRLTGYQEVPSLNTTGHATLKLDVASNQITFKLDYADLTGPPA